MRRSSSDTRDHVLAVTRDLFYWRGIRATGVDQIASAAGVATTTLYRLFRTKDELVTAYVQREADGYRAWFSAASASGGSDPRARIRAVFAALADQVRPDRCRGCPFQMAMAELVDTSLPGHAAAVAVKVWTRDQLRAMAADFNGVDSDALADELLIVLEGVYASVESLGSGGPAARAGELVERLIALPPTSRS